MIPLPYDRVTQAQKDYLINLTKEKFKLEGDVTLKDIITTLNNHFKTNHESFEDFEKKHASILIKELIDLP